MRFRLTAVTRCFPVTSTVHVSVYSVGAVLRLSFFSPVNFVSVCFIAIFRFADYPTSSHSTKTVSPSPAFLDEEEFSDFMQGPVEVPTCGPSSTSQPFQSFHSTTPLGQLHVQKAGAQPLPPGQSPVSVALRGVPGQIPCFFTASASYNVQETGNS